MSDDVRIDWDSLGISLGDEDPGQKVFDGKPDEPLTEVWEWAWEIARDAEEQKPGFEIDRVQVAKVARVLNFAAYVVSEYDEEIEDNPDDISDVRFNPEDNSVEITFHAVTFTRSGRDEVKEFCDRLDDCCRFDLWGEEPDKTFLRFTVPDILKPIRD